MQTKPSNDENERVYSEPRAWTRPGPNGVIWCSGSAIAYDGDRRPCGYIVPNTYGARDGLFWAQRYCWRQGSSSTIGTTYVETRHDLTFDEARAFVEEYADIALDEAPGDVALQMRLA